MHHIYHDIYIAEDKEKVFKAVTQPNHLVNWWPLTCSGTLEEGELYNFYFGEGYNWFGQVTSVLPNQSFHIRMTDADMDWNPTSFGFDLEVEDGGVWLQFWHKNWPELNHHFRRSSCCWAILLQGLKNYIEAGEIIPFGKRA